MYITSHFIVQIENASFGFIYLSNLVLSCMQEVSLIKTNTFMAVKLLITIEMELVKCLVCGRTFLFLVQLQLMTFLVYGRAALFLASLRIYILNIEGIFFFF